MSTNFLYLDQLFDEIFNNFFYNPTRAKFLLDQASKDEALAKRIPSYPVSNFYIEKDGTSIMEFAVPGFSKDDIKVLVDGDVLTIEASKQEDEEEPKERTHICRRIAKRNFSSSFKLASIADVERISVDLKDGLLKITVPIKEREKQNIKQIEIK